MQRRAYDYLRRELVATRRHARVLRLLLILELCLTALLILWGRPTSDCHPPLLPVLFPGWFG